jgi:hypothetical protein
MGVEITPLYGPEMELRVLDFPLRSVALICCCNHTLQIVDDTTMLLYLRKDS